MNAGLTFWLVCFVLFSVVTVLGSIICCFAKGKTYDYAATAEEFGMVGCVFFGIFLIIAIFG